MRVLITGSRTWTDSLPIFKALDDLNSVRTEPLTIVHGGAGRGADRIAAEWFVRHRQSGLYLERFPADWKRFGSAAGIIRNAEMVKAGADLCLAFIRDNSRGATHCAQIAAKAGIETRIQRWPAPTVHEGGTATP